MGEEPEVISIEPENLQLVSVAEEPLDADMLETVQSVTVVEPPLHLTEPNVQLVSAGEES